MAAAAAERPRKTKQKPIGGWDNLPNHPGEIRPPGRKANYRRWGEGQAPTKPAQRPSNLLLKKIRITDQLQFPMTKPQSRARARAPGPGPVISTNQENR